MSEEGEEKIVSVVGNLPSPPGAAINATTFTPPNPPGGDEEEVGGGEEKVGGGEEKVGGGEEKVGGGEEKVGGGEEKVSGGEEKVSGGAANFKENTIVNELNAAIVEDTSTIKPNDGKEYYIVIGEKAYKYNHAAVGNDKKGDLVTDETLRLKLIAVVNTSTGQGGGRRRSRRNRRQNGKRQSKKRQQKRQSKNKKQNGGKKRRNSKRNQKK
jgi:hypothetical protein